jgi:hypothetical protein
MMGGVEIGIYEQAENEMPHKHTGKSHTAWKMRQPSPARLLHILSLQLLNPHLPFPIKISDDDLLM